MVGRMDTWIDHDGCMDGWKDGWMDGRMDRLQWVLKA
jgi:hypothetical protein